MFGGTNKTISIVYNDFALSLLAVTKGELEQALTYQIPLEKGIVKNGMIEDEDAFFNTLKDVLKKKKIKRYDVRMVAPANSTVMKKINLPAHLTTIEQVEEYIEAEMNDSIRVPFSDPLYDIYDEDPSDGEALLFASEREEITKVVDLMDDLDLDLQIVDLKYLADLRIVEKVIPNFYSQTMLVLDWSMDQLLISIINNGKLELNREYTLRTDHEDWSEIISNEEVEFKLTQNKEAYEIQIHDALNEIDQIVHFYQYSLNKGTAEIQRVINIGDHPMLTEIDELIEGKVSLQTSRITDADINAYFPGFKAKHSTLLGLAIKGGHKE
ncbi:hypothetical protein KZO01_01370 [Kurthia zopfii]|uniref:Tfp pilus assembly PilM family ATPase n=1 Tax=Kurthia zopfii TaxID=1650 RepID=A0A8B4QBU5_9BACL|nr:pilus assembly protein PilM [Kurthia zopfii]PWI23966.1 hypothetical protein DF281_00275 [Kurthia zopfii]TDR44217.1 Tfp pilus assembly PilM family ATPase [Kurthia zopfii]GEK29828.1 hypothetical protein KZO01_01370 [Kurthia zopfii]STX10177.1 type IV pilus assembly protein PilM [Kurthia zopfii]